MYQRLAFSSEAISGCTTTVNVTRTTPASTIRCDSCKFVYMKSAIEAVWKLKYVAVMQTSDSYRNQCAR